MISKSSRSACSLADPARGLKPLELWLIPNSGPYFRPCTQTPQRRVAMPSHDAHAPSRHTAARPVPSPASAHSRLLSVKIFLCEKPPRHFLEDLLKVRPQFKRTPANAPVFNKTSLLPWGSAASPGRPWLRFGWGAEVGPATSRHYSGEHQSPSAPPNRRLNGEKQPHSLGVNPEQAQPRQWAHSRLPAVHPSAGFGPPHPTG